MSRIVTAEGSTAGVKFVEFSDSMIGPGGGLKQNPSDQVLLEFERDLDFFVVFFCLGATFWRSDLDREPLEEDDEEDDDADGALILCLGDGLGEGEDSFIMFEDS